VARGKIDLFLTVEGESDAPALVTVNHSLAAGYMKAYEELAKEYGLPCNVTAESLARVPDVLTVHKPQEDEEHLWQVVKTAAVGAVDAFIAMREKEGQRLKEDVESRIVTIREAVSQVEAESPKTVAAYRARLEEKMRELLDSASVDEQRLITETAIFADRVAVDEETVRLGCHLDHIEALLAGDEPVGRKLDFLMQEANREINTIGSKCQNTDIANIVVTVKAELEKIREQIQNLE
ncbi:MAG: YicC family protein, partial [Clostridia bacterium]|nr:YicC family protein [Clostridia bacterium]